MAAFLRKAIEWRTLLTSGAVVTQAALARREGLSRARVTQILQLLRLAPEIHHDILSMPDTVGKLSITEHVSTVIQISPTAVIENSPTPWLIKR